MHLSNTYLIKSLQTILLFITVVLFNSCYKEQELDFNTPLNELELRCKIDGKAFSGVGKYIRSTPQNRHCSGGVDAQFIDKGDSTYYLNIDAANCGFAPIYTLEFTIKDHLRTDTTYILNKNNSLSYNTYYSPKIGHIKFSSLNDSVISGEFDAIIKGDNKFIYITEGKFLINLSKL